MKTITNFKHKKFFLLPLIYSAVCGLLYYHQKSFLYFPDKTAFFNDKFWQPILKYDKILALESLDNFSKTVILFHGNSASANIRTYYSKILPKNTHMMVAEYPGFGMNKDLDISKESFINHSREVLQYAKDKYGDNITLIGESLGTGIASQMASEFNIKNLLLITPYSSIADVAQKKFWYAPVSLLLKDNYNSIKNLKHYKGHTLMLISEKDQVILPTFSEKLYNAIPSNKKKIVIKGAGHSNWLKHINQEQLTTLSNFLQ